MKRFWQAITVLALAVLVVIGAGLVTSPAEAQCAVRADWPVYRVVRGDTLSRIARRYGLTTLQLMQANCLTSSRIITGQSLRVPPLNATTPTPISAGALPPMGLGTYLVSASYQPYEFGFMIWWANTGDIWAFYNNGGAARVYPLAVYGGLNMQRVVDIIPAGRMAPQNGFGRVWSNFAEVRAGLGWATAAEQGYQLFVQSPGFGASFVALTLPDNKVIKVSPIGTWSFDPGSPAATFTPSPTDPRIGTTFQPFDNGFMLWRADTGDIWVFIGQEVGEISRYANSAYGGWRILPVSNPGGRITPQNGFGKLWSNVPAIRDGLGFATAGESGYLMTARIQGGETVAFGLPDGRIVSQRSDGRWQVSSFGPPPTPFPTAPPPVFTPGPTVTVMPPPTLMPNQTGATFQIFENGFLLWRADTGEISAFVGRGQAERLSYPLAAYSGLSVRTVAPRPGRESALPTENGFGKVWTNNPGLRDRI
ncbi:MAG: LysM peptidoglycan-binding domain-containing protein, partial [Anaerolineae bacterium]|nr:LysM peptidoglycan-binding domain-containing protein [Anaerolineae bacterium]